MKKLICFFTVAFCAFCAAAVEPSLEGAAEAGASDIAGVAYDMPDVTGQVFADPIEDESPGRAICAQRVFAGALLEAKDEVDEQSSEFEIQAWVYKNFQSADTIKKVLACPDPLCEPESAAEACPDISEMDETESISFPPVIYRFPGGREITVNYETQPKILKQRLALAGKRAPPCGKDDEDCISPRVGAPDDSAVWTHTDPAWYGILVVQAGTLDRFVGEDKNNVISLRYFNDNIKDFYPRSHNEGTTPASIPLCTTRSAFADDNDIVNLAAARTVGLESYGDEDGDGKKDTNDYYIAGDVNLQWISWAQVALDVVITVATVGGGTLILGATKGAAAARAMKNLAKTMKTLKQLDKVKDYEKAFNAATKTRNMVKELDAISDISKLKLDKADDLAQILKNPNATDKLKQIEKNMRAAERNLERTGDVKHQYEINRQRNLFKNELGDIAKTKDAKIGEISRLEKEIADAEKLDDVKKLKEAEQAFLKLKDLRRGMKAWKIPQRGNVIARPFRAAKGAWKTLRAINKGGKEIRKGAKIARAGMKSGKIRDRLFHFGMRNAGRLAKVERQLGMWYGVVSFAKGMYDWTETATGEFTSNIEFKPLGLLSADNIEGQENVVNHGMWLMWAGDSLSPADDDAAYLQSMDFANKFAQDMNEVQDEKLEAGRLAVTMCDVDIYVVRPIVRYLGEDEEEGDGELYYLIMNDIPWTVRAE